ncbi:Xab2 [Symbiodinium necroappetens]|uniref:Xab2 protein n=1 Tax=Symbiodinium necroappetens TaxID=1628268 RepID=A0A813C908_9DINO|nr:Xab2 [Symbiodinium necroappetens]
MNVAALELGPQPVLLSSGHGWGNVTRFAGLSLAKLAELRWRAKLHGASALLRCLHRLQESRKRHCLLCLRHRAAVEAVSSAKHHADETLKKLRMMVDSFDLEADDSVEAICRQVLDEDDETTSMVLKH